MGDRRSDEGGVRSTLNLLFRHALEAGKRARTETAIGRGTASVSHAAVEMATDRLGALAGRARARRRRRRDGRGRRRRAAPAPAPPRSSSPTARPSAATELAERVGGRVARLRPARRRRSPSADVVLTCTGVRRRASSTRDDVAGDAPAGRARC